MFQQHQSGNNILNDTRIISSDSLLEMSNESNTSTTKNFAIDTITELRDVVNELPTIERKEVSRDWFSVTLLIVSVIFAIVLRRYNKYFRYFLQSFTNPSVAYRMFNARKYPFYHGAYLLQVIYYVTFSLFVFQALVYFIDDYSYENWGVFLLTLAGITIFFLLKKIIYLLIGIIVNAQDYTEKFIFNMDNYFRVIGIFLFPVVAFIFLNPFESTISIMIIGASLTIIFYLFFLFQSALILIKKEFSIFYLFLYLCTLEILPLLLVVKWITDYKSL